jgi:hypothetical protein
MTFTPADQAMTIEADVRGEQTGNPTYSAPTKSVANSSKELLAAAADSACKLCESAEAIAAGLKADAAQGEESPRPGAAFLSQREANEGKGASRQQREISNDKAGPASQ